MNSLALLDSRFLISNVKIPGRLLLAPMDGYTDAPFRDICHDYGSSLSTSEFINGIDLKFGHPHLKTLIKFSPSERPFSYQIFDDDPQRLLDGARKLLLSNPDIIDINMGCSARNVSNRGAGAGLLKQPDKIRQIATEMVKNLPIPVTAKIRLGWDENTRNYLEITKILEDCGISAITVHARTRQQQYQGKADWDAIAEIKAISSIPIIGNGDVTSRQDAMKMIVHTSCDAVMIGRAAIGNPWVFSGRDIHEIPLEDIISVIFRHLAGMVELYSPRTGVILFRKHLSHYLKDYLPTVELRKKIFTIEDQQELQSQISELLQA